MTVINQNSTVTHNGNGVTDQWPYTFNIPDAESARVGLFDVATSVLTELPDTDYSITGLGDDAGGEVTYPLTGPAITAAKRLVIWRELEYTQDTDLTNQTPYYPEVLETQLDRIVMQIQQLSAESERAIKVTLGSSLNPDEFVEELQEGAAAAAASAAAALISKNNAETAETNAEAAETLAEAWASNPEDVPVTVGPDKFSALHWAAKAAGWAAVAASNLIGAILGWTTQATPLDADIMGYVRASDSAGRKFTFANLRTFLLNNFVRFDAAQVITAGQQNQLRTNVAAFGRVKHTVFTANGNWTPDTAMLYAELECVGAGGGGGGVVNSLAGQQNAGGGGGGGAYASITITKATAGAGPVVVTVPVGGTAGAAGANGGNGGDTSIGAHCVAQGGRLGNAELTGISSGTPGAGGTVASSTGTIRIPGMSGQASLYANNQIALGIMLTGGHSGKSFGWGGASPAGAGVASPGVGYGGGGGGAHSFGASGAFGGGAGAPGIAIITEYCSE